MITRLGDVATYINGYAFKPSDWSNEGKPIIRIQDLTDNSYQMNRFNGRIPEKYYVKKGDVLISWSASLGVYRWTGEDAVLNQHIFKVVFDKTEVDKEFFIIQAEKILKDAQTQTHGATMKHLTKPMFDSLRFYYPPLAEQREIVMKMGAVRRSIEKRKAQLKKLDDLVKSQFIEMFGDPFTTTEWDKKPLREVSVSIYDGSNIPKDLYCSTGSIVFYRIQNVWRNEYHLDDLVYISSGTSRIYSDSSLNTNDILITKIGRFYTKDSSLGRVALYKGETGKAHFSNNIMRIRLKAEVKGEYINALLNLDVYQAYIKKVSVGGTDKRALSKMIIGELPIPVPPIDLQKKFVALLEQTDKSKVLLTMKLFFHLYTAICLKAFEKSSQMMYNHR